MNHDHVGQESVPLTEVRVDGEADVEESSEDNPTPKKKKSSRGKEQSVLQAKLTKLAVQIGYAGNDDNSELNWC